MKYVRDKTGKIEIMEDRDSISAGAETIFSTEPAVYEGTWDKETSNWERGEEVPSIIKQHADISTEGRKQQVQEETVIGDIPRDTSYIGTKGERKKTGYDPESVLKRHQKLTGWKGVHKAQPKDKVCLNCGKPMPGARPNRKFCSDNCRKRYTERIRREEKRAIKKFVPHKGNEGQIYYMYDGKVGFIPALWCDSMKRAEKYVKENYPAEVQEVVLEQVKEVIGK